MAQPHPPNRQYSLHLNPKTMAQVDMILVAGNHTSRSRSKLVQKLLDQFVARHATDPQFKILLESLDDFEAVGGI